MHIVRSGISANMRPHPIKLENPTLIHLYDALRDLDAWLGSKAIKHAVCGGVAEALLWRPHLTCTIDVLCGVPENRLGPLCAESRAYGFEHEAPVSAAAGTSARLWHASSLIEVRLQSTQNDHHAVALERALSVELQGVRVAVPTPEDFLILEARRNAVDHDDIDAILATYPQADQAYLRQYLTLPSSQMKVHGPAPESPIAKLPLQRAAC